MSAPVIPQRPARSDSKPPASQSGANAPLVPPRPAKRLDRSASRERDASARSPLNEFAFTSVVPQQPEKTLSSRQDGPNAHLPRPPSVSSLPMVGQEGFEYASLDSHHHENTTDTKDPVQAPNETKNVASDLPLHAPKASMTPATAKSRIATVTRTDSSKAAVAGVGRPITDYVEPAEHDVRPQSAAHGRSSSAVSTERAGSAQASPHDPEQEHGIPEIGLQVPMNPMAGDVQAPTPGPGASAQSTGVGYFNEGSRSVTVQGRTRSAQGFQGPPGSYGLHGHGVGPHDQFEKKWYQKHPEELAKEESGAYGPALSAERPEWAMSSDELNKLVRDSSSRLPGMGTKASAIGTPSEAIGYQASEEYSSRLNSPRLPPTSATKSRFSRPGSQTFAESPLRRSSSASEDVKGISALESENEDDHVLVKPPSRHVDKYSGAGYDPPTVDLGPHAGNTEEKGGWINEQGRGTPILASDEVAKNPAAEHMLPAVSPAQPMTEDEYFAAESDHSLTPSRSRSRSSRPTSLHSFSGMSKLGHDIEGSGTPLEEIEEYEPLFTDEDDQKRPTTTADKVKRPDLERHRFPSKDVWEDTPTSLQLQTTVETPQEPGPVTSPKKKTTSAFEHPDREQARKGEITENERLDFLTDPTKGLAKPKFGEHLQQETSRRPGLAQRFPSRDVWEDTPDSLRLETTVGASDGSGKISTSADGKLPANKTAASQDMAIADRSLTSPPERPAVPARSARAKVISPPQTDPTIPPRPSYRSSNSSTETVISPEPKSKETSPVDRKAPTIPERPKPQVPVRAVRAQNQEQPTPDTTPKAKPAVPARPAGGSSKFASIKAGFMNDLNSRLQVGPKEPPKPQTQKEEDKGPLSDARKSRARGPARRKPAASPSPLSESYTAPAAAPWSICDPVTVWSMSDARSAPVAVPSLSKSESNATAATMKSGPSTAQQLDETPTDSPLAKNTAGEPLQPRPVSLETSSGALAHTPSAAMDARARDQEEARKGQARMLEEVSIGHTGGVPEPLAQQPALATAAPAVETASASSEPEPEPASASVSASTAPVKAQAQAEAEAVTPGAMMQAAHAAEMGEGGNAPAPGPAYSQLREEAAATTTAASPSDDDDDDDDDDDGEKPRVPLKEEDGEKKGSLSPGHAAARSAAAATKTKMKTKTAMERAEDEAEGTDG